MVTFIAQKPSFSSTIMYILGKKKKNLMQISDRPGSSRWFEFWPGPGTRSITDLLISIYIGEFVSLYQSFVAAVSKLDLKIVGCQIMFDFHCKNIKFCFALKSFVLLTILLHCIKFCFNSC